MNLTRLAPFVLTAFALACGTTHANLDDAAAPSTTQNSAARPVTDAQSRTPSPSTQREGRVAPPADAVTCDRNDLTLYSGRVTAYRRTPARTTLTIETDWDTTERVVIRHARGKSPAASFLIEGRKFTPADWRRIEERSGTLREGVRANAWVCADGRKTVVDWQGAAEPTAP